MDSNLPFEKGNRPTIIREAFGLLEYIITVSYFNLHLHRTSEPYPIQLRRFFSIIAAVKKASSTSTAELNLGVFFCHSTHSSLLFSSPLLLVIPSVTRRSSSQQRQKLYFTFSLLLLGTIGHDPVDTCVSSVGITTYISYSYIHSFVHT